MAADSGSSARDSLSGCSSSICWGIFDVGSSGGQHSLEQRPACNNHILYDLENVIIIVYFTMHVNEFGINHTVIQKYYAFICPK